MINTGVMIVHPYFGYRFLPAEDDFAARTARIEYAMSIDGDVEGPIHID
ncbi:hypothetical protein [Mesorhizobium sangaii]|uniref:Uncharacterized protein n=1 Tax=Mesorhizobium sangaii TaxID=505389 RepID=A0A841PBB2_9HYPH|nr:hypothetical protein [Mesorhizobium sangaii]MBB6410823.1 hypothetical protein [Mesorhizobium sangaii]